MYSTRIMNYLSGKYKPTRLLLSALLLSLSAVFATAQESTAQKATAQETTVQKATAHETTAQPDSLAAATRAATTPVNPKTVDEPGDWLMSDFYYGLYIGTGPRWTLGRLNEYFSWAWDFTIGANLGWSRWMLEGSVTFASPTIKKKSLMTKTAGDDKFHANVKNANYSAYGINLGFSVVKTRHISVTPFAGVMWTRYSWTSRPLVDDPEGSGELVMGMPQKHMKLTDFNIDFGINFDWHFNTFTMGTNASRQALTSSLRVTPYAVRGVYSDAKPSFGGWQLGLRIAYSASARKLHRVEIY